MQKIEYIDAGAGSGKTYTLTHRLADYLSKGIVVNGQTQKILPSEVIISTFTVAAANEIKERARAVLLEPQNNMVSEASMLDSAAIGTVHSVCQQFLKKYWFELGIAPDPEVITEEDRKIYQNDSLGQMLTGNEYAQQQQDLQEFFLEFQPKVYEDEISSPAPDFWVSLVAGLSGKIRYYNIDSQGVQNSINASCNEVDAFFNAPALPASFQSDYTKIVNDALADWQAIAERLWTAKGRPIPQTWFEIKEKIDKISSAPTYYNLIKLADALSDIIEKDSSVLNLQLHQVQQWLRSSTYADKVKACIQSLFVLAQAWLNQYKDYKRQMGVIDYDDMEMYMLDLLNIPSVREDIAQTYKLVMGDEFQDCNPVQLRIFMELADIVSQHSPLAQSSIWVGDPKQAIYGFRGSDTDLINRVASKFPPVNKVVGTLKHTSLDESRRSREDLVKLANNVFSRLFPGMTQLTAVRGELPQYGRAIRHWNFAENGTSSKDFHRAVAKQVKELLAQQPALQVGEKRGDGDEPRSLCPKDIAILCRTGKKVKDMVSQLRIEAVPASAIESKIDDYAEVQLVLAVLNLAEHTDNPHETASLLRLWKGLSTSEVLLNRLAWCQNPVPATSWQSSALSDIHTVIEHLKDKNLSERISTIILELGLYDHVRQWEDSDIRVQNLMTLQNVAATFVRRCARLHLPPTASNFCLYLQETEIKPVLDTTSNTVKVMTYHASKGLEWPVVLLASLDADDMTCDQILKREYFGVHESAIDSEFQDTQQLFPMYQVICMPDFGMSGVLKEQLWQTGQSNPANAMLAAAQKRVQGEMSRLLYVGVTRARDYLISLTNKADAKGDAMRWLTGVGIFNPDATKSSDSDSDETKSSDSNFDFWQTKVPNLYAQLSNFATYKPQKPSKPRFQSTNLKNAQKNAEHAAENERLQKEYDDALGKYAKDLEEYEHPVRTPQTCQLRDLPPLTEQTVKELFQSPSTMGKSANAPTGLELVTEVSPVVPVSSYVKLNDGSLQPRYYSNTSFGTCIHNIFAACPATDANWSQQDFDSYVATAKSIIANFDFANYLTDVPALVQSLQNLYIWLEKEYGPAQQIVHEYPFTFAIADGQIMSGEIDLLWVTDKGAVIVDFKNYYRQIINGSVAFGQPQDTVDPSHPHYAGHHYTTQLQAYKSILEQAGVTVLDCVLYYDLMGCCVRF